MLHRRRRDVVGEAHALDLLLGLERPCSGEERRRVGDVAERAEPVGRERRRLADHPVGRLRSERELEPDPPVLARCLASELEDARAGRARVDRVVALEEPHVARPRHVRRVLLGRLETDQRRLALTREDARVVPLHPPEVREVEDVVGRADDERVELVLGHERAHALELRVVARPAHQRTRGGAGSKCASSHDTTGLRRTPIRSISHSMTSPGLR